MESPRHEPLRLHVVGLMPVTRLLREIFPRDMWIHRLDIADATARPFHLTADHNGVMVAQVVRDAARYATPRLPGLAVVLRLRGAGDRSWSFGAGEEVSLELDVLDYIRLASERATPDAVLARAITNAPPEVADRVLAALIAPF